MEFDPTIRRRTQVGGFRRTETIVAVIAVLIALNLLLVGFSRDRSDRIEADPASPEVSVLGASTSASTELTRTTSVRVTSEAGVSTTAAVLTTRAPTTAASTTTAAPTTTHARPPASAHDDGTPTTTAAPTTTQRHDDGQLPRRRAAPHHQTRAHGDGSTADPQDHDQAADDQAAENHDPAPDHQATTNVSRHRPGPSMRSGEL